MMTLLPPCLSVLMSLHFRFFASVEVVFRCTRWADGRLSHGAKVARKSFLNRCVPRKTCFARPYAIHRYGQCHHYLLLSHPLWLREAQHKTQKKKDTVEDVVFGPCYRYPHNLLHFKRIQQISYKFNRPTVVVSSLVALCCKLVPLFVSCVFIRCSQCTTCTDACQIFLFAYIFYFVYKIYFN